MLRRIFWSVALMAGFVVPASAAEVRPVRVSLGDGLSAMLTRERQIFVETTPQRGEGLLAFARRLTSGDAGTAAISEANSGAKALLSGIRYRVPYGVLKPSLQVAAIRALFGDDSAEPEGWRHQVHRLGNLPIESLAELAEWFTGQTDRVFDLRDHNQLADAELAPGDAVLIPARLLRPHFRALLPASTPKVAAPIVASKPLVTLASPAKPATVSAAFAPPPGPATSSLPPPAAAATGEPMPAAIEEPLAPASSLPAASRLVPRDYRLEYGRDAQGDYAIYRLRPGEALYSSVVVRFTGRVLAADVNELAGEIAVRSRIGDVTDIPIGYRVKIPYELLLPEFLPPGHPRRREYEESLLAAARFDNPVQAFGLAGVTVILDSGHGGRDVGASFGGVWESLYVHDILLRVRQLLETHTQAKVVATVADGKRARPDEADVLPFSRNHRVLTSPPYAIEDAAVGTNLRWYLANSLFRREMDKGVNPEKVVFLSLHADSLHPSLRGAMVYIPDAQMRGGTFGKSGTLYAARTEYREQPQVSFSWQSRVQSEGLSRDLARHLIAGFEHRKLPVHPDKPVRELIIRRRSMYVPAVLRYNAVPAKVLLEVCNLANGADRAAVQTAAHRQTMAEAIVEGLLSYYGYQDRDLSPRVAAVGK